MQKPHLGELIFFFALFGVVALFAFMIMSPYLTPLFLAVVFAILFSPLHRFFLRRLGGRPTLAALATVLVVLVVIIVPLATIGTLMFEEVFSIYGKLTKGNGGFTFVDRAVNFLEVRTQGILPETDIRANVYGYIETGLRWIAQNLASVFSSILALLFGLFLVLIGMFFLYRDGDRLRAFAIKWSPLPDAYDESILGKLELAISTVVKGALTTAMAQGLLVGAGFALFGVANPVLWGVVASVAALIPILGTAVVTMPAAVILGLSGHVGAGVGLAIWALIVVGLSDNVLQPMLVRRGVDIHPFLILLSIFGGLAYFGPVGFLAGPIALAFFFTLLDIYPAIMKGRPIENGGKETVAPSAQV